MASGVSVTSSSAEHKEASSSPEEISETSGSGETWAAPIAKPEKTAFMRVFSGPGDRAHNIKNQSERAFTEETLALRVPERLILSMADLPPQFVTAKDQLYRNHVNFNFFKVVALGLCVSVVTTGFCVLDLQLLWVAGVLVVFVFLHAWWVFKGCGHVLITTKRRFDLPAVSFDQRSNISRGTPVLADADAIAMVTRVEMIRLSVWPRLTRCMCSTVPIVEDYEVRGGVKVVNFNASLASMNNVYDGLIGCKLMSLDKHCARIYGDSTINNSPDSLAMTGAVLLAKLMWVDANLGGGVRHSGGVFNAKPE